MLVHGAGQFNGAATFKSSVTADGNVSSDVGDVTFTDDISATLALTVGGALLSHGPVELNSTLTLEEVAFSGPVRFGSAAGVLSSTNIAHGLGVVPTAIFLTPITNVVGITYTWNVYSADATSIVVGCHECPTLWDLYWLAGK